MYVHIHLCVCVTHEHTRSVLLVLRGNCWVLNMYNSPVWSSVLLWKLTRLLQEGKLSQDEDRQPGPGLSTTSLAQTDKAEFNQSWYCCFWPPITLCASQCSHSPFGLSDFLGQKWGEAVVRAARCHVLVASQHKMSLGIERHLHVVIIRDVLSVVGIVLCHWASELKAFGLYGEISMLLFRPCVSVSGYLCSSCILFVFLTVSLQLKFWEIFTFCF